MRTAIILRSVSISFLTGCVFGIIVSATNVLAESNKEFPIQTANQPKVTERSFEYCVNQPLVLRANECCSSAIAIQIFRSCVTA